jgi:hypothetical protein
MLVGNWSSCHNSLSTIKLSHAFREYIWRDKNISNDLNINAIPEDGDITFLRSFSKSLPGFMASDRYGCHLESL